MSVNWTEVSDRIHSAAFGARSSDMLPGIAENLGITDAELRDSLDGRSRLATIKVMVALARRFDVDISWMLTGDIDPKRHRRMSDRPVDEIEKLVKERIRELSRESQGDGGRAPGPQ